MKYRVYRVVDGAHGTQTYQVDAESIEEAVSKFNKWDDNQIVEEEFDIDPSQDEVCASDVWEHSDEQAHIDDELGE